MYFNTTNRIAVRYVVNTVVTPEDGSHVYVSVSERVSSRSYKMNAK
jgi:hypothetical protein